MVINSPDSTESSKGEPDNKIVPLAASGTPRPFQVAVPVMLTVEVVADDDLQAEVLAQQKVSELGITVPKELGFKVSITALIVPRAYPQQA